MKLQVYDMWIKQNEQEMAAKAAQVERQLRQDEALARRFQEEEDEALAKRLANTDM